MPTRIHRTPHDMLVKGRMRSLSSEPRISTFSSGGKEYSIDSTCRDSQERVYIPPAPVTKVRPVATGNRISYSSPANLLAAKGLVLEKPRTFKNPTTVKVRTALSFADVSRVMAGGTHPTLTPAAWVEANSYKGILLPTAANYLCPKCGLTRSCTCDSYDKYGRKRT